MRGRLGVILLVAALGAMAGFMRASFSPTMYASGATIQVVPQRVPEDFVRGAARTSLDNRLAVIRNQVLTRTKLERMINDLDLYADEIGNGLTMEDAVTRLKDEATIARTDGDVFSVSYVSDQPRTAMKVAERLASLFVEENLRDRETTAAGTVAFLDSQIDETGRRLDSMEKKIEAQRKAEGRVPQSQLLNFEVLQATYRSLLTKAEEARTAANLERRQIGQQFRVIEAARLPERPVEDGRLKLAGIGALAGLGLGVVFAAVLPRRKN